MSDDELGELRAMFNQAIADTVPARLCTCPRCLAAEQPDAEQTERLLAVAEQAIRQAMQDGAEHGKQPGEWLTKGWEEHTTHAYNHGEAADFTQDGQAAIREHLQHCLARCAMALALLEGE